MGGICQARKRFSTVNTFYTAGLLALAALAMAVALPTSAEAVANSCNGTFQLNYVSPTPNFPDINSTVRIELTLGAGTINGGTTLTMTAVRLDMACKQGGSLITCATTDADPGAGAGGPPLSYDGDATITTTCAGITWSSNSPAGGTSPNQLVFSPSPALAIPAQNQNFCTLSFATTVKNHANNNFDPDAIIQIAGLVQTTSSTGDATCNTTPTLTAAGASTGTLTLCPTCPAPLVCEQSNV